MYLLIEYLLLLLELPLYRLEYSYLLVTLWIFT